MARILILFVCMASSVFATGICECPPSIFAIVNNTPIAPGNFTVTSLGEQGYSITANIVTQTYSLALNVTTNPDPAILLGMSIGGDPMVDIIISQFYLGGPFPNLTITGGGNVSDGDGNMMASLTGSPYIKTTVTGTGINGSNVNQLNLNCLATGAAFFQNKPCPNISQSFTQSILGGNGDIPHGTLEMEIKFNLSDGDSANVNASAVLGTAAVPEPGTGVLLAGGLLLLGGYVVRRQRA